MNNQCPWKSGYICRGHGVCGRNRRIARRLGRIAWIAWKVGACSCSQSRWWKCLRCCNAFGIAWSSLGCGRNSWRYFLRWNSRNFCPTAGLGRFLRSPSAHRSLPSVLDACGPWKNSSASFCAKSQAPRSKSTAACQNRSGSYWKTLSISIPVYSRFGTANT